uniref:Uncharacterized protein n=1 Tax=Malurus cyaneus samueli TaxID=2593467 RepID=A0A8C5TEW5_9PASS
GPCVPHGCHRDVLSCCDIQEQIPIFGFFPCPTSWKTTWEVWRERRGRSRVDPSQAKLELSQGHRDHLGDPPRAGRQRLHKTHSLYLDFCTSSNFLIPQPNCLCVSLTVFLLVCSCYFLLCNGLEHRMGVWPVHQMSLLFLLILTTVGVPRGLPLTSPV